MTVSPIKETFVEKKLMVAQKNKRSKYLNIKEYQCVVGTDLTQQSKLLFI